MLSIFRGSHAKLRKEAKQLLEAADKVWHYRRDLISEADARELRAERDALAAALAGDPATLQQRMNHLDAWLRRVGGQIHPRTWMTEYVEMIVVAAILAIGVRSYVLQPFAIPTNSMYPSYYGMTHEIVPEGEASPPAAVRPLSRFVLGSRFMEVLAEGSGEVWLLALPTRRDGAVAPEYSPGDWAFAPVHRGPTRPWAPILKGQSDFYVMKVGDKIQVLRVPADFDVNGLFQDYFAHQWPGPHPVSQQVLRGLPAEFRGLEGQPVPMVRTGLTAQAGQPLFRFRLLTGDHLFVDRISYHFRRPAVGEPFVFRTDDVPGMSEGERGKYYIKRIGAGPGDTFQIRPPVLFVNGEPATQSAAFVANAERQGAYEGYITVKRPDARLPGDQPVTVPPANYVALGDNSDQSADSRYWGFVPEKAIIGRAVLIYYPFTERWGPSD